MTLNEISYDILETIRAGSVVDDERIDVRLIDELVNKYRIQYAINQNRITGILPELYLTSYSDTILVSGPDVTLASPIPKITEGRFGVMIKELYDEEYDEFAFTYVNRGHFRYVGNSTFNSKIIFYTYKKDNIYFKNKEGNHRFMNGSTVVIDALFEDPRVAISNFDRFNSSYPIDYDGAAFVKDSILNNDIRFLLNQNNTDEISDSSGEIKE